MTPPTPGHAPIFRPHDRLTGDALTAWQQAPVLAAARHFHTLHRYYGVAEGLIVRVAIIEKSGGDTVTDPAGTAKADKALAVRVSPGIAVDACSRLLEVEQDSELELVKPPQPEKPGVSLVLLRGDAPTAQQMATAVPVPLPGKLVIERADTYSLKPWDVPLASFEAVWEKDSPPRVKSIEFSVRANAIRSFRRPYMAGGRLPGGTTAQPLAENRGWQIWIDTGAAGFLPVREPRGGQAGVGVPPVFLVTVGRQTTEDSGRLLQPGAPRIVVSEARHDGFLLTVDYGTPINDFKFLVATPLEIRWTGIEQRVRVTRCNDRPQPIDQTEDAPVASVQTRRKFPWHTFDDGRPLTAADLNDVQSTVRELQWLHTRALHDWGVGEGLSVAASADRRAAVIQPGVAFDVEGREVVLSETKSLPVPPQKLTPGPAKVKEWWIAASYRDRPAPRDSDPDCRMQGVPLQRLPEAVIRWVNPDEPEVNVPLNPGYDMILATAEIGDGVIQAVTAQGRRSAVPPKMPYVASGRSERLGVLKSLTAGDKLDGLDLEIEIDTTDAGFHSAPVYTVQLESVKAGLAPEPPVSSSNISPGLEKLVRELTPLTSELEITSVVVMESGGGKLRLLARVKLPGRPAAPGDAGQFDRVKLPGRPAAPDDAGQSATWLGRLRRRILDLFRRIRDLFISTEEQPPPALSAINISFDPVETNPADSVGKIWVQEKLHELIPYRFAWIGIEG